MRLISTACPLCGSKDNFSIVYRSNFQISDFNENVFSARRLPDRSHYRIVKCNKDGLVRSNPILEGDELALLYKDSKFNYQTELRNLSQTYLAALQNVLGSIPKDANILEIGCGNGFILEKLYDLGYKNVFGLEPSHQAVSMATKRLKNRIVTDVLREGLFPDRKFNLIFFFQTFDHIPDPNNFLDVCYRMLSRSGYVLSFNHNVESWTAKILGEKSPIIDIEHTFLYSPSTMTKIFAKHGFSVMKLFFPRNTISLRHLTWSLPIPRLIKNILFNVGGVIMDLDISIPLGNLCLIAQKTS